MYARRRRVVGCQWECEGLKMVVALSVWTTDPSHTHSVITLVFDGIIAVGSGKIDINYFGVINDKVHNHT